MSRNTPREWSYWTENKLQILSEYLPAFNVAAKKSHERIYIDLMAGRAQNISRSTGEEIAGSPRRALETSPGFTRNIFCELPQNADQLEADLRARFPRATFEVVPGDCNDTIGVTLSRYKSLSKAPTFAFIDQQAAEVHWTTLQKLAEFKSYGTKAEQWILMSPVMIARGTRGTNNDMVRKRVTQLYGTDDWLRIQRAKERRLITPKEYRAEMVNLIRYRLAEHLGYSYTHRIPMLMPNRTEIYDMVFATDHHAGDNIMRHLYKKAAQREPGMMEQAVLRAKEERIEKSGQEGLFELEPSEPKVSGEILWQPESHWDPSTRPWW